MMGRKKFGYLIDTRPSLGQSALYPTPRNSIRKIPALNREGFHDDRESWRYSGSSSRNGIFWGLGSQRPPEKILQELSTGLGGAFVSGASGAGSGFRWALGLEFRGGC